MSPRKRLYFDNSPLVNKRSGSVESKSPSDTYKMESSPRTKLKPQKLPWLALNAPEKDTPKDAVVEKPKLKPRKLPELQGFVPNDGRRLRVPMPGSCQGKNPKVTPQLNPQKHSLLLSVPSVPGEDKSKDESLEKPKLKPQKLPELQVPSAPEEAKVKNKSLEKPKLKPRKLPELQGIVPNQNWRLNPQPALIKANQSPRETFAAKRTRNGLQSEETQRKKPKLDQPVVRRNLFKEPAKQHKSKVTRKKGGLLKKKEPTLKVTEASITDDIRPLETTLPTTERKPDDFEVEMPKSCSPTPSEEFLALENAVKNEMSFSNENVQIVPTNKTFNSTNPEQIVEMFYAAVDSIQNSVKEQLEKMMTEVDQKFAQLKEDFKKSLQKCNENKENMVVRRSPRLLKTRSPAFSPINTNLRMSTLKKNFQKKVLFRDSTPKSEKVKKAEVMYNSLRQNHPLLRTPKFKSTKEEMSQEQSLSIVLQQQCLMLQDTPAHK